MTENYFRNLPAILAFVLHVGTLCGHLDASPPSSPGWEDAHGWTGRRSKPSLAKPTLAILIRPTLAKTDFGQNRLWPKPTLAKIKVFDV